MSNLIITPSHITTKGFYIHYTDQPLHKNYLVYVATDPDFNNMVTGYIGFQTPCWKTFIRIHNEYITSNTTYYVRLRAVGSTEYSNVLEVKTLAYAYVISGSLNYANTAKTGLHDFDIWLWDTAGESWTKKTDGGMYSFYDIPAGSYRITVNAYQKPYGGINSTDAFLTALDAVGIKSLQGIYHKAADVNGDGVVNSVDWMLISRFFTGSLARFSAGEWCFEEKDFIMGEGYPNPAHVDILGLCYGDVNGSYIPA